MRPLIARNDGMVVYLNLFRKSCAEHERLTVTSLGHRVLLDNAPNLRLEAHVQHAVSFVQDQEPAKTRHLRRQVVI